MLNNSDDILYTLIIPLISSALGFFGIFKTAGTLPGGQRRNGIFLFFSCCTISFLLFLLLSLPLSAEISGMLKNITYFCFVSIPVIYCLSIVRKRDSGEYFDRFAAISIIMLFLFSIFYSIRSSSAIFVIYIPTLAACIMHSYNTFRESVTPRQQGENFRNLCILILLGITPPLTFLLSFDWQEASLLIFIVPLWAMWETWKIESEKQKEDYTLEMAVDYAAPVILFAVMLLIFRGAAELSDNLKSIDFTFKIRLMIVFITALTGTMLMEPLKELMKRITYLISQRYVDAFSSTLSKIHEQKKTFDMEDIHEHLLSFFPGIDTSILFRLPFQKVFEVFALSKSSCFDITDSLFIDGIMLQDFEREGYSILTPANMEHYNLKSTFMEKALIAVERSNILLIPLYDSHEVLPSVIFSFIHNEKPSFSPGLIRNLYLWAKVVKLSLLSAGKKMYPETVKIPDELMQIADRDKSASAACNLLKRYIPLKRTGIIMLNEAGDIDLFPPDTEIPDKIIAEVKGYADSKAGIKSKKEEQRTSEIDPANPVMGGNNYILVKIPSSVNAIHFIYLEFKDIYYHSLSAGKFYEDFAFQTGLLLDKLNISESLNEHKDLVNYLEHKIDTQRLKVAEDLHDTVAQEMYAARMLVEMLEKQLQGTSPHTTGDIKILRSAVNEGLHKTREMIAQLRDADGIKTESIIVELKKFFQKVGSETGMKIHFENVESIEHLSENTAHEVSMIIREAINNSRKHSGADSITVRFSDKGDDISLEIRDNGKGFLTDKTEKKDAFGMAGMKSRCVRLGGKLEVISSPEEGTLIRAVFKGSCSN